MKFVHRFTLGLSLLGLPLLTTYAANGIPIIDAHSQLPAPETTDKIIELMGKAGVSHTILSFRGSARMRDLLALAASHPTRITPAIKAKGRHWPRGNNKYFNKIEKQLATGKFSALGEALFYHAAKGNKAPE